MVFLLFFYKNLTCLWGLRISFVSIKTSEDFNLTKKPCLVLDMAFYFLCVFMLQLKFFLVLIEALLSLRRIRLMDQSIE